ncbi:hypothetical protein EXS74_01325 [Candidatus Woesearchaeota archaeon]|nr:hypothetical protein [Candidatus Woesearchaeota archaeon]
MFGLDFLGGGVLAFVVVLVAIFILGIIYKIIIAPILRLFGFGVKGMGKSADLAMNNWVDSWNRERKGGERERREYAEEGQAQALTQRSEQVNQQVGRILSEAGSTQNLGQEKVDALKALLKEQEDLLDQDRNLFKDLETNYGADRKNIRTITDDLKTVFRAERDIERRSLDIQREIERYTQGDPNYSKIAAICEQVKLFETQIQDIEARDIDLARQLQAITENRRRVVKVIRIILEDSRATMKKEPILPELPHLMENQQRVEQGMQQLLALNEEAKSLITDHTALLQPLENITGQVTPLLEQQEGFIRASLVKLAELAAAGAIPKKTAA